MNITRQHFATISVILFMAIMLWGCANIYTTTPGPSTTPYRVGTTPLPVMIESPNPAFALAQATMDTGQSQLLDLSRRSTEVSLNMSQAANAAALSTQDFNRRQKMDLDYQSTVVSLNIAQAAATQKFITQQTKTARDANAAAQSSAAAATHTAYLVNVTQTARAQSILDTRDLQTAQAVAALTTYPLTATALAFSFNVTETMQAQVVLNAQAAQAAQAIATLTAYPMTATPFAVTQAALLMQQYNREQQSFFSRMVIPLIPFLAVLDLVLFILLIVYIYREAILMPWPRRLRFARGNFDPRPLVMIEGVIADPNPQLLPILPSELTPANLPKLPDENSVHVEIVDAAEPPVAHWIAEVEHQMAIKGGLPL